MKAQALTAILVAIFAVAGFACGSEEDPASTDFGNIVSEAKTKAAEKSAANTVKPTHTQQKSTPTKVVVPTATAVPPTPDQDVTVNGLKSRNCDQPCSFAGEAAMGAWIKLSDGRECFGNAQLPCYVTNSTGQLAGGVVNPRKAQVPSSTKADFAYTAKPAAQSVPSGQVQQNPPPQPAKPDTVNGLDRRECPNSCDFTNEAARGQFIRLSDGRECSGTTDVPCYIGNATGTVHGGTRNPYNGEVKGKALNLAFALPAPTPKPCETIGCGTRREISAATMVTENAPFRGAYVKLPNGRECIKVTNIDCYVDNVNGATVAGGVLYPYNQEYLTPDKRQPFK